MAKLRTPALRSCVILLAWLGLQGCGNEVSRPTTHPKSHDAGEEFDASADGSANEQDGDVEEDDAGTLADGGSPAADGGKPKDPPACELSEDANSFSEPVPFGDDSRFSLTTGTTGFGVAFQGNPCDGVGVLPVQSSGAFAMPTQLVTDCANIRDMSMLHVTDGWRVVWIDNSAGSGELQSMLVSENMSGNVGELRTRLTTNSLVESRPALANVGGKPLLAFIAADSAAGTRRISTLVLDGQATVRDLMADTNARKPSNLALAQTGADRAAVVWVEDQGMPGVWLQATDLTGAAQGTPEQITGVGSGGTTVDLAMRDLLDGGAVLYSVSVGGINDEVRMRRIGADGRLATDERKIIGSPLQARDASFARLGGGYVVVYRALPGGPITAPEIRMTFISKEGNQQHDATGGLLSYKIADTNSGGGRVTVRVSTDGQLLIGFVDAAADGGKQLRLVRKRLDCAL